MTMLRPRTPNPHRTETNIHTQTLISDSFIHSIAARSQSTAMTHCKSRQSLTPDAESSGLLARAQWKSRQPEDRVSLLLKLRCHDIQSRLPHKFLTASLVQLISQQQQRRRRHPPRHHHHNSFSPAPVQKKLHAKHSASFLTAAGNGSVDPAYPESDHTCHSWLAFPSLYSSPPSLFPPSCSSYTTHAHVRKREARVRPCASVFPTQATASLGRVSLSVCCLPVHSVPLLFAQSLCLSSELTHTHTVTRKTTESLPLSLSLSVNLRPREFHFGMT